MTRRLDLKLSKATLAVFDALEGRGHEIYLVGGAVRDAALNRPLGDIDLATNALPEQVMTAAKEAGLRSIPTGIEHGTVTVLSKGLPHEITTFRRDMETDGRHAIVAFGGTIKSDATRRDFTMNALYAKRDGEVLDPVDGWSDLQKGRVRFVGDAARRIQEDALRILRFFRFHAWYGQSDVDQDAMSAIATHLDGLRHVSAERIIQEMRKLLSAENPAPSVASMQAAGVLNRILPGCDTSALAPLVHLEEGRPIRWLRRLAVLGGDRDKLRLSNKEKRSLADLNAILNLSAAEAAWRKGHDAGEDAALVRSASTSSPLPSNLHRDLARGANAKFPLNGDDLLKHMEPSKKMGIALRKAESLWLQSEFKLTKADLLEQLGIG